MSLNNLPAALVAAIQTGMLAHEFRQPLEAKLGFRALADRENFPAAIGESLTKTRRGLLPAVTTPLAPAANTDLTSGLTPGPELTNWPSGTHKVCRKTCYPGFPYTPPIRHRFPATIRLGF